MPFATWWRGDPLPDLPPLSGFQAHRVTDRSVLEPLTRLSSHEIERRFQGGHDIYVAFLDEVASGYGWVAHRQGDIDELQFSFQVPPASAYLWDFVTLPEYRGRGVYPQLLQAIIRQEPSVERFWIGYAPDNEPSGRGIRKAGFEDIGEIMVSGGRVSGITIVTAGERAKASADVLGVPIVDAP